MAARFANYDLRRFRGHRGGVIPVHRSMVTLSSVGLIRDAFTVLFVCFAWIAVIPHVLRLWAGILAGGSKILGIRPDIGWFTIAITHRIQLGIPYLLLGAEEPTPRTLWLFAMATLAVLAGAFSLGQRWMPLRYLLMSACLIQLSAVFYFALATHAFPHDLAGYQATMMVGGLITISLVPLLFGLTYYILEFGFFRKVIFTVSCMGHLVIFIPLQYLIHGYLIHRFSLILMPVLYMLFGLFLDVFLILAFYSWAVGSGSCKNAQGRDSWSDLRH